MYLYSQTTFDYIITVLTYYNTLQNVWEFLTTNKWRSDTNSTNVKISMSVIKYTVVICLKYIFMTMLLCLSAWDFHQYLAFFCVIFSIVWLCVKNKKLHFLVNTTVFFFKHANMA